MRKLILITLFLSALNLSAQKISSDTKHVYSGMIITMSTSTFIYNATHKKGLSIFLGWVAGVGAGALKEYVWDGKMNRGVKNPNDFALTSWGATVGVPVWFIANDIKEKKIDTTKFNNLKTKQL